MIDTMTLITIYLIAMFLIAAGFSIFFSNENYKAKKALWEARINTDRAINSAFEDILKKSRDTQ
jgi:hypothetical protein